MFLTARRSGQPQKDLHHNAVDANAYPDIHPPSNDFISEVSRLLLLVNALTFVTTYQDKITGQDDTMAHMLYGEYAPCNIEFT